MRMDDRNLSQANLNEYYVRFDYERYLAVLQVYVLTTMEVIAFHSIR